MEPSVTCNILSLQSVFGLVWINGHSATYALFRVLDKLYSYKIYQICNWHLFCIKFLRFSEWCTARNHQQHYRCWSSSVGSKQSIEDVATCIKQQASNILVMVGAGLSTASGIPDFRWATKIYIIHSLQKAKLGSYSKLHKTFVFIFIT